MQEYPHLFSPLEIAGHTYRKRILAAPMIFGFVALRGREIAQSLYRLAESRARDGAAKVYEAVSEGFMAAMQVI